MTNYKHKCDTCGQTLPLDPEAKKEMLKLYLQGYTQAVIAERFGVSQGYVSRTLKEYNADV